MVKKPEVLNDLRRCRKSGVESTVEEALWRRLRGGYIGVLWDIVEETVMNRLRLH